MRTTIIAIAALATMAMLSTAALACSISDIEVKQATLVRNQTLQLVSAVGEVYNGCADAIGVALEAVFRNKAGQVVIVDSFWAADIRNIPAHTFQAFDHPSGYDNDRLVTTMDLRVIELRSWVAAPE
jgi:hypothetical protein